MGVGCKAAVAVVYAVPWKRCGGGNNSARGAGRVIWEFNRLRLAVLLKPKAVEVDGCFGGVGGVGGVDVPGCR